VNIASIGSCIAGLKVSEYVPSKHALWGFHHCLRQELKQTNNNIDTTIICPWVVNTGLFNGYKSRIDFLLPMLNEEYVS
jgi:all-trans-retinol dehydrogenase (NAD+)